MSSFRCLCGVATRDEAAPDASLVAYSLPTLNAIESRIAESVAALCGAGDGPDRGVVEDVVSRELNDGFLAMFRCPSCDRLWLCDPVTKEWASYRAERAPADA